MKYLDYGDWGKLTDDESIQEVMGLYDFCLDIYENYLKPNILKEDHGIPLYIETCYNDTDAFGIQRPRDIRLYLFDVIESTPARFLLTRLTYILAHELFHVNQNIDRSLYEVDDVYTNIIERSDRYKTYQFLVDHRQKIEEKYSFCLDTPFLARYVIGAVYSLDYQTKKDIITEWENLLEPTLDHVIMKDGKRMRYIIENSSSFFINIYNENIPDGEPNMISQIIKIDGEYLMPNYNTLLCINAVLNNSTENAHYRDYEWYVDKHDDSKILLKLYLRSCTDIKVRPLIKLD